MIGALGIKIQGFRGFGFSGVAYGVSRVYGLRIHGFGGFQKGRAKGSPAQASHRHSQAPDWSCPAQQTTHSKFTLRGVFTWACIAR